MTMDAVRRSKAEVPDEVLQDVEQRHDDVEAVVAARFLGASGAPGDDHARLRVPRLCAVGL